jgi:siroheme synthase (precorrin-2 oxidase/ferrochelatase)
MLKTKVNSTNNFGAFIDAYSSSPPPHFSQLQEASIIFTHKEQKFPALKSTPNFQP